MTAIVEPDGLDDLLGEYDAARSEIEWARTAMSEAAQHRATILRKLVDLVGTSRTADLVGISRQNLYKVINRVEE